MRVLVYGAGAVGGYLGACLAHHAHEVTMVTRPVTANIIDEQGLTIRQPGGRYVVRPRVVSSVRQAFLNDASYDLILMTMKSYDLADAINPLLAFCPNPPPVITLQNGIGLEEMVIEQLGPGRVVSGTLTTPVSREIPERIIVERENRGLGLAPTAPEQNIGQWVQLFQSAGLTTEHLPDFHAMKWSKALLNMIGNATSAILNRHPSVIYKHRPTYDLEIAMLRETLAVMRRLKYRVVDLPGTPTRRLANAVRLLPSAVTQSVLSGIVAEGRGNKMPSFHIDLVSGRHKNEVLYHNAAVAQFGQKVGVSTPVNQALGDILLKIVTGEIPWETYQGNPQKLVTDVKQYQEQVRTKKQ